MSVAWRRLMRHTATIRRNTTSQSATGVTKFNYATIAEGLPCSIQDSSGRLEMTDAGLVSRKKRSAVFGPEADIQENDLVVVTSPLTGTFRVFQIHAVAGPGGGVHHLEANLEPYVPAGDPAPDLV